MVEVYAEKSFKIKLDATLVFVTIEQIKSKQFNFKNTEIEKNIIKAFASKRFTGEFDCVYSFNIGKPIIVFGLGKEGELNSTRIRIAVKHLFANSELIGLKKIELVPHIDSEVDIRAYVEGCLIGTYKWDKYITEKNEENRTVKIVSRYENLVWYISRICDGVNYARELINENADVKNSEFLEKAIYSLIKKSALTNFRVLQQSHLEKLGMNLFLAVNRGSRYAPKLVIVEYIGGKKGDAFTAILGKGITFDSGGLNLKPSGYMETMREDMSGTAAVIGTLKNILELKPKKNLLFACAIAENAISRDAYKPGDVYIGYNKKSVEIGNTDAEGRLILADSIAYLTDKYKIKNIIDIATLTGSIQVTFGNDHIGLMTNNQKLAQDLISCGEVTDDRIWQLPMYFELKDHLKSLYADIKSIGQKGKAGSLSAAEFLRQFVKEGTNWAHLDIAGTSFIEESEYWYYNYGATGSGVRLLTEYLTNYT